MNRFTGSFDDELERERKERDNDIAADEFIKREREDMHLVQDKTLVTVVNPWTGKTVTHDISTLTERQLQALPLDEDVCNKLATTHMHSSPEEFLQAYVATVGPHAAGRTLLMFAPIMFATKVVAA